MLNPQQKQNLITCTVLVIILGLVTACSRPQFKTSSNNTQTPAKVASYDTKEYEDYLKSLQVDPKASQDLYQQVISVDDVKQQVEQTLEVNQKVEMPAIKDADIKISSKSGSQAVTDYFKQNLTYLSNWKASLSSGGIDQLFTAPTSTYLSKITDQFSQQMYNLPVPKEAVALHKSQLVALAAYKDLFALGASYDPNDDSAVKPWPQFYHDEVILDAANKTFNAEFNKLNAKYSINTQLQKELASTATGNLFVPAAHAIFGFGDIVIDVQAVLRDVLQTALQTALVQFMIELINKLVEEIETNYKIANFLYYTDALVSGQYVDDYIAKYYSAATNALDKNIIERFIPEIGCGLPKKDLAPFFTAQAAQSLGFDPTQVSPNDPNYYSKMAQVGDFLSSPQGWQVTYEDAATQADAAASQAAHNELVSAGLKAGRDPKTANQIATTAEVVGSSIKAALYAYFELGPVTSTTVAGAIAGQAVQVFIHSYLFKGAVFKEQSSCVAVPVLQPVIPGPNTPYKAPATQTTQDSEAVFCSSSTSLTTDCTNQVYDYLMKCAANAGDSQSCATVAGSPYVQAYINSCPPPVDTQPNSVCAQYRSLVAGIPH